MWRRRRWVKILDLLEYLPRTSAYAQAMATDMKLAEKIAALPQDSSRAKPQWRRTYREFSPEVEMLSALFDRIGELIRVTAGSRGAKTKQPMSAPRPIPAIDRIRYRTAEEKHKRLTARVLPNARS